MNRFSKMLLKSAMSQAAFEGAKIVGIIGGLVVLVSGVYFFAISRLALGLVAAVISGKVRQMIWSVAMVAVGLVAYALYGSTSLWSYGPILVIISGAVGIVLRLI